MNTIIWKSRIWKPEPIVAPITQRPSEITRRLRRQLLKCLSTPLEQFTNLPGFVSIDNPEGLLLHRNNGHKLLGVAHLDVVSSAWSTPTLNGGTIQCGQLDDRLGVWVLLYLLPALGFDQYDILLTDNEETGFSTANYFSSRNYNWSFAFDRSGTDVATYQYGHDVDWYNTLRSIGIDINHGSYSDIADLRIGVCGLNMGVGYHHQHTTECYADLNDTVAQCKRFVRFADEYYQVPFPFVPQAKGVYTPSNDWPTYWDNAELWVCKMCREELEPEWLYCPWCGERV